MGKSSTRGFSYSDKGGTKAVTISEGGSIDDSSVIEEPQKLDFNRTFDGKTTPLTQEYQKIKLNYALKVLQGIEEDIFEHLKQNESLYLDLKLSEGNNKKLSKNELA